MNESVKHIKKHKKNKVEKKHKKNVSKDTLASKFNALEVVTKHEKAENIWPKATSSTELFSSFNIPDILVTPQKKEAISNHATPPNAKRKFSGDNTSHDGEPIQESIDYPEASEERRIRTKSLPQPPSHTTHDFASAPLPVNINTQERENANQDLLNKKFSIASKNDCVSAPIYFHTSSKLETTNLSKSSLTITLSEPISVVPPTQRVEHQYVNNSPRQPLQQRSHSMTDPPKPDLEDEAGYLKTVYTSLKNTFTSKNKLHTPTNKKGNDEDALHSHSQPQIVSPIKPPVVLKQCESKPTDHHSQKNLAPIPKHKMPDGAPGQKFPPLAPKTFAKSNEKNTTPPKSDNKLKLPNQKLPPTTNLNKPNSKIINPSQKNSELENVKQQLHLQGEQIHQLLEQQSNQNLAKQNTDSGASFLHNKSNKGTALHTIFHLLQATEQTSGGFNAKLTGTHHEEPIDHNNKQIDDKIDQ